MIDLAKDANRDLTSTEADQVQSRLDAVARIDIEPEKAKQSASIMGAITKRGSKGSSGALQLMPAKATMAGDIMTAMNERSGYDHGQEASITTGDVYTDVPLAHQDPLTLPLPPATLLDVLPVRVTHARTDFTDAQGLEGSAVRTPSPGTNGTNSWRASGLDRPTSPKFQGLVAERRRRLPFARGEPGLPGRKSHSQTE
jgi:hypothetical protein